MEILIPIELKDAAFSYENKRIFENINIKIESGKLYCLMGVNGCGKSTLLDCILGVNTLKKGEILLYGKNINEYKAKELARNISYVPQVHERSFPYTVKQIVLMGRTAYLTGYGNPSEEDEKIVEEALKTVSIEHLKDRVYTQISGGEMQLVILARALVQEAPTIIMDEPTAHLDFKNELVFMETVVKLIKEKKSTIIMATHSPNQAFYFEGCGIDVVVAVMDQGSILCEGSPKGTLTEEKIRSVYKIEAKVADINYFENKSISQIIPIKTIREEKH